MALTKAFQTKDVQDFVSMYRDGRLNLSPAFQRQSVWTERDRKKLLHSILLGFPVPSIFLYRRTDENGRQVFDVLDGKQRIESLFYFMGIPGFGRNGFSVKWKRDEYSDEEEWTWADLKKHKLSSLLEGYKLQVVEVDGELSEIIELFVRINSTGRALAGAEKRHAKFYSSKMLKQARVLADKHRDYLERNAIIRPAQAARMKDVELVAELLASMQKEGVINKKAAIDRALSANDEDGRVLRRVTREFTDTMRAMRRIFPRIKETRLHNGSEFYSLSLVIWRLAKDKMVLIDKKRNDKANKLLVQLSTGVDEMREALRKHKAPPAGLHLFSEYLASIERSTDNSVQRETRDRILSGLLRPLFERKDDRRLFSPEQRRLLWHSDATPKCSHCGCTLNWANFEMDHRKPHSRGGKTALKNATLSCKSCNASKGNRKRTTLVKQRRATSRTRY